MLDLGTGPLAHRLGQLAELLGQPRDARRRATTAVAVAIGALDDVLQFGEVHRGDGTAAVCRCGTAGTPTTVAPHVKRGAKRTAKRGVAIVNPERSELAGAFDGGDADLDIEIVEPERADDLPGAAEEAVAAGAEVVAAVGGDGTQRAVADAVAGTDTELVVVPGGTVNLLGRVLGIHDADDALAALEHGRTRPFDRAWCNDCSFLLNSSSGYDADVIDRTGDRAKRFGRLGYTIAGLIALLRAEPRHVTVTADGETVFDGDSLTVLVFNVPVRGSTSFRIAPDAEPDDGKLDLVVIRDRRRSLVRFGLDRFRRRPVRDADAVVAQAATIEVRWEAAVAVQCDGDVSEHAAAIDYTVEPRAVNVRTP